MLWPPGARSFLGHRFETLPEIRMSKLGFAGMFAAVAICFATTTASSKSLYVSAAQACQLSIPTTDTKVRPRATGYNNEGTANAFVICGFANLADDYSNLDHINRIVLAYRITDGIAHVITCTAVNGLPGSSGQMYVTKTLAPPIYTTGHFDFTASDFFSPTDTIPDSFAMSVTCNLPGKTSLTFTQSDYDMESGT
jgi:hypothetical protein